jgi:hypothetical protein
MKRFAILLTVVLVAGTAFGAAVKFNTGMNYNLFSDSRITGMSQAMGFSYAVGDYEAGWTWENAVPTATDSTATSFPIAESISAMHIARVLSPSLSAGLEFGQATTISLTSAAFNQVVPLLGLFGTVSYESKGKDVTTCIAANVGFRIVDIADCAPAAGWTGPVVQNLNAINVGLTITIGF